MSASALWTAVVARYDNGGLLSLTNVRTRNASAINTTVGEQAATDVINFYFPTLAQQAYDPLDSGHVALCVEGVIALLWKRGGTAQTISRVNWEDWETMAGKFKGVTSRARIVMSTNSQLTPSQEVPTGEQRRPWADRGNFRFNLPGSGIQAPDDVGT